MTSAYIGNGQFVDGNTLFAADLTAFGADMTAAIELVADTALLPNPGARGVGIHQPLPHPSLSMVNPAYTGPVPIQALALSAGYGVLAQPPVQALPFAIQIRGVTSVSGAPQVAMGSKFFAWIGCDGSGNATGHYYANTGTVNAPQVTEYVLSSTKAIADGNVHEIAMQLTASGGALFVDRQSSRDQHISGGALPAACPVRVRRARPRRPAGTEPVAGRGARGCGVEHRQVHRQLHDQLRPVCRHRSGIGVPRAPQRQRGRRAGGVLRLDRDAAGQRNRRAVLSRSHQRRCGHLHVCKRRQSMPPNRIWTASSPSPLQARGPNWFEPFVSTLNIFVASAAGAPLFRWM